MVYSSLTFNKYGYVGFSPPIIYSTLVVLNTERYLLAIVAFKYNNRQQIEDT